MLTGQLVRPTYRLLSLYSRLNFIPININGCTGKATASPRTLLRRGSWYLNCTCLLLLVGFLNWKLLQCGLEYTLLNPVHFPLHFIITAFLTVSLLCMYVVYIASPLSTIHVYNELVDHLEQEIDNKSEGGVQDLLLLSYPFLLVSSGAGLLMICAVDPQRMQFFYATLSPQYQIPVVLALNIVVEFAIYNVGYATMSLTVFIQLAFFRDCLHQLRSFCRKERMDEDMVKRLRRFHLILVIFNGSQATLIFVAKIFLLCSAICMNVYGIHILRGNTIVGVFSVAVGAYAEVSFIALYDNAFAIPLRFRQLRVQVLKNGMMESRARAGLLQRQIRALPAMGIKVGQFYLLERQSTPNFLDFVLTNTANMLVTLI